MMNMNRYESIVIDLDRCELRRLLASFSLDKSLAPASPAFPGEVGNSSDLSGEFYSLISKKWRVANTTEIANNSLQRIEIFGF